MTASDFPFKANFPTLYGSDGTAPLVTQAIAVIGTEWSGITSLYSTTGASAAKKTILEGYLVAWWLADMYPTKAIGISGDGGMPLTSKSIGGVSVSRKDLEAQPSLKQLESNMFGVKALSMIMSAPERFMLHGQRGSLSAGRSGWGW